MHQTKNQTQHVPVLLEAVLTCLDPKPGDTYLDLTAGYGGHASAILELTKAPAILVDRDDQAITYLRNTLASSTVSVLRKDFLGASQELAAQGKHFKLILADLGVSSPHLNTASRGFSLQQTGPLDMRMDQSQTLGADKVVNTYSEEQLRELLTRYGEEPRARQIAQAIVRQRPFSSTTQLADAIVRVYKVRGKVHPATRSFQAIRMVVNSELEQLSQALPIWLDLLEPGGRIAVISFHSLEDRIVKTIFSDASIGYEAIIRLLTKKPIVADHQNIVFNPRARSAKLRAAVKIKNQKEGVLHAHTGKKHLPSL